jgi:DNA-binding MarR family transcriptional regulator
VDIDPSLVRSAIVAYARAILVSEPLRVTLWDSQGFTVPQLRLMYLLLQGNGISAGQIAERLGVKPASVTGLTDRLVCRGLIEREHDRDDHRVVHVTLTPEGRRAVEEFEAAASAYLARVFERMGEDAVRNLVASLEAFRAAADSVDILEPSSERG